MTNFKIDFSHPWLLLLLIPAAAVILIPYLRLAKKYRCTRNRITSIVLHSIVMVLCVSVLAGMTFSYDVPNKENEVLLLVDMSFSNRESEDSKDEFIRTIIEECDSQFKLGVVTFGYDQVYAAELTNDTDKVYGRYLKAPRPDGSATDIASAFRYARTLFAHPKTARIVLISDGLETDGDISSTIKSVAAEGIKVDTVFFPTERKENEVQLIGVELPDYNITVGDTFNIGLTLQSSFEGQGTVTVYDNDSASETQVLVNFTAGVQTIELEHSFALPGMHELRFEIVGIDGDTLNENNEYHSYIYLQVFDKILIVERTADESQKLSGLLNDEYNVTVTTADDTEKMPDSLDELCEYDQVILVNIAFSDMPDGFEDILHSYVYEAGGGLFTVGGDRIDGQGQTVANAYNRADMMQSTYYKQMLPVQAIDYTPPLGVMIIIDRSGSMGSGAGSNLELAKEGAMSCLNVLTQRDWCGIMTLETDYSEEISLTPMTQMNKIVAAIDSIETGGGTVFQGAIARAGKALEALTRVEKRHILLVSDGMPGDSFTDYGAEIEHNYKTRGITFSIITVGGNASADIEKAAEVGHGHCYSVKDVLTLPEVMKDDLSAPEIKEVEYEEFTPTINEHTSVMNGITQENMPKLSGYYGTKLKDDASAPLMGKYVPIYAQWKYGKGMVGSFMCNLSDEWSGEFFSSATGIRFVHNVVGVLFPTEDIRSKDINVQLKEDNYSTQLSIFTKVERDQTIEVTVTGPPSATNGIQTEQKFVATVDDYSRITFKNLQPGVHKIHIAKKDASGNVLSQYTTYRTFSYSAEYNMFFDPEECKLLLAELAQNGNGQMITDPWDVFKEASKSIHKVRDPRLPFLIIAIVLFLLEIAVRKFKFKWPHELIREYREKKALKAE